MKTSIVVILLTIGATHALLSEECSQAQSDGAKSDWGESWWPSSEPEAAAPRIESNRDRWHEDAGAEESDDEAAASDDAAAASDGAAAESDGSDSSSSSSTSSSYSYMPLTWPTAETLSYVKSYLPNISTATNIAVTGLQYAMSSDSTAAYAAKSIQTAFAVIKYPIHQIKAKAKLAEKELYNLTIATEDKQLINAIIMPVHKFALGLFKEAKALEDNVKWFTAKKNEENLRNAILEMNATEASDTIVKLVERFDSDKQGSSELLMNTAQAVVNILQALDPNLRFYRVLRVYAKKFDANLDWHLSLLNKAYNGIHAWLQTPTLPENEADKTTIIKKVDEEIKEENKDMEVTEDPDDPDQETRRIGSLPVDVDPEEIGELI